MSRLFQLSNSCAHPVYTIVDDVAVASDGPVHSVFLAHEGPIEKDRRDRTRSRLVHVGESAALPSAKPGSNPASSPMQSLARANRAAREATDRRLRRFGSASSHGAEYNYWDLGAEWKRVTGLPFVFALWLIRPEVADPSAVARSSCAPCAIENLAALDEVIAAQKDFSAEFCCVLFSRMFAVSVSAKREKAGLLRFRSLCEKHGLCQPEITSLRLV